MFQNGIHNDQSIPLLLENSNVQWDVYAMHICQYDDILF